jgi:hypothetical protein
MLPTTPGPQAHLITMRARPVLLTITPVLPARVPCRLRRYLHRPLPRRVPMPMQPTTRRLARPLRKCRSPPMLLEASALLPPVSARSSRRAVLSATSAHREAASAPPDRKPKTRTRPRVSRYLSTRRARTDRTKGSDGTEVACFSFRHGFAPNRLSCASGQGVLAHP